jgi:hypothetical protein
MENKDVAQWKCRYRLEKRLGDINACKSPEERLTFLGNTKPYEVIEGEGNCLLNTGIDEMWDLIVGDSANHFNNASSTIGVGDSNTAANATQTDLQAATNKTYKGMETGYPTSTSQKATCQSLTSAVSWSSARAMLPLREMRSAQAQPSPSMPMSIPALVVRRAWFSMPQIAGT